MPRYQDAIMTAMDHHGLALFIRIVVLPGTRRACESYQQSPWKHFLKIYGGGANAYLKGVLDAEKAALVGCTGGTRRNNHVSNGD